ncbi:putative DNA-binding transcriptional regulator YafY [Dysgonomonas alginatilytica]|uniref:Putative DNA-binding transcriptional regulator YafY n=1 Tax=Dysgonomonas alginatilytica TaxID=1605892 RepID=A0A2V3PYA9_9BACT|nr:YafY family protein [Dysgonomonas alginatilytica]PXV66772.1 putative DNA-binding transcriptional regulator YafY [Dysgonomonas alginatilytica]
MNRLERISSILVQLQSRSVITAQQIADRFDISLRTVYRDIRTLEEAGIPIIGNVGIGYSLVDGYKLPPLMFTREEAIAFLTAEKFIEKMSDLQNVQSYKSGMSKIKAVLKYIEKDYLSDVEDNISILGKSDTGRELPTAITQCILKSISEQKVMRIIYFTNENMSERDVEPIGCFYSQINWYMVAFCRLRNDYRSFRIDKISSFALTDEPFSKEHLSLPQYIEKYRLQKDIYEVIIRVKNSDLITINDYKYYHGWLKEEVEGDYTDIHFRIFNLEHFARWYLSFADIANIIKPDILKEKVKDQINSLLNKYSGHKS